MMNDKLFGGAARPPVQLSLESRLCAEYLGALARAAAAHDGAVEVGVAAFGSVRVLTGDVQMSIIESARLSVPPVELS